MRRGGIFSWAIRTLLSTPKPGLIKGLFPPSKPIKITSDRMLPLEKMPKDTPLELLFATKEGLPIPRFPVSHSAIALRNPADDTFSIYGRQSPLDFLKWFRDGISLRTRVEDEKRYLNPRIYFTGYPTESYFSKKEVEEMLHSADHLINEKQYCDMARSNCYSFTVTVMSLAIEKLVARAILDSRAIGQILTVLEEHPLTDHYSVGVLSNKVVVDKLLSVLDDANRRLTLVAHKSAIDHQVLEQINHLMILIIGSEPSKRTKDM